MWHVYRGAAARFWVLVLLAALPGCNEENKYEPPPAPKVGVAQPAKRPVTRYLELTGNTVSLDKVELVARAVGFLREINYKDGSMVKKGDVLFAIEPAPYEAKVQQAEAEVRAAKAALVLCRGGVCSGSTRSARRPSSAGNPSSTRHKGTATRSAPICRRRRPRSNWRKSSWATPR